MSVGKKTPDSPTDPPQFPAGPFCAVECDRTKARHWIDDLEGAPERLRSAVAELSDAALDTAYRNWTIRQIVHHLADSHMNAYIRCKLAMTEDRPTIKPYDESLWSGLQDARGSAILPSLKILEGLHARWGEFLRSLPDGALDRVFYHPESGEIVPLWQAIASYAWHGRHHTAQIEWVRQHKLSGPRSP